MHLSIQAYLYSIKVLIYSLFYFSSDSFYDVKTIFKKVTLQSNLFSKVVVKKQRNKVALARTKEQVTLSKTKEQRYLTRKVNK